MYMRTYTIQYYSLQYSTYRSHCPSLLGHLDNVDFCDAKCVDREGGLDSCSVLALLDSDLVAFGVQSAAGSDEGEHTLHGDAGGRGRGGGGEYG